MSAATTAVIAMSTTAAVRSRRGGAGSARSSGSGESVFSAAVLPENGAPLGPVSVEDLYRARSAGSLSGPV